MGKYYDDAVSGTPREEEPAPAGVPRITVSPGAGSKYPEASGGSFPPAPPPPAPMNKEFGTLKPTDPSWTEWLRGKTQDALSLAGAKPHVARHLAEGIEGLGNFTPMGTILSVADLTYNLPRGNYGAAAFDALGAWPGVRAARRVMREGLTPLQRTAATPTPDELTDSARQSYRAIETAPLEYHPTAMRDYIDWVRYTLPNPSYGRVFSPEAAPQVYSTLDRFWRNFDPAHGRRVTAYDFDQLRQQLKGLPDANGPAGRQAVDVLDTYMLNPPRGMLQIGDQRDLARLREQLANARGNYRAGMTGGAVSDAIDYGIQKAAGEHSGRNIGNRIRQNINQYVTSPTGEARLFGATQEELAAIANAAAGDKWTNRFRAGSNRLSAGGGAGQTVTGLAGGGMTGGLALSMGLDPQTAAALALTGGMLPGFAGGRLRSIANERTERAARDVVDQIARNSPLARAWEAASPSVPNAMPFARDAMAMAIMQQGRNADTDWWNSHWVPHENR